MNRLSAAVVVCLLVLLIAVPGAAFTPDDEELSASLTAKYGPLRSWEAEMSFPDYPGVRVEIAYASGQWRQKWQAETTVEAVGFGEKVIGACTPGGFALSPLFVWLVPNPVETWKEWGVAVDDRGYGFYDGAPCFILGAEPADPSSSVIYLHNETRAPLLIRYMTEVGLTSVVFSKYKVLAGYSVPQQCVVTVDGTTLTVNITWKAVNGAGDKALYVKESVSPIPCAEPPAPFDFLRDSFRIPSRR
ncbi:hypothetical protein GO013_08025 [Pseudodesulfovibrio sp. JC047]|nr:hypothetical protein [Pseudodesulfovibrio sp. JC047]